MPINRQPIEPKTRYFEASGSDCPNNPQLPALIYPGVFEASSGPIADQFERAFRDNGWTGCWRWSVHDYHHFHSNAHEALGVSKGSAKLQLGGEAGEAFDVSAGTLVILPAGTGHKKLQSSSDFFVVGSYPRGQNYYDTSRTSSNNFYQAIANIANTPLPETDPIYGPEGPLTRIWKSDRSQKTGD